MRRALGNGNFKKIYKKKNKIYTIGIEGEPTLPNLEPIEFQILKSVRIFDFNPSRPIFDDDFKSAVGFNF